MHGGMNVGMGVLGQQDLHQASMLPQHQIDHAALQFLKAEHIFD
jgi:hypothetical protein